MTSKTSERPAREALRQRARGWAIDGDRDRLAVLAAAVAVALFGLLFLLRLGDVIGALYSNSDNASALVLAELFGDRGTGNVVLGHYAWLEPLFAYHWTAWLPWHRQLWEIAPLGFYLAAVLTTAWTLRRAASARLAVLVGLAMLVPGPVLADFVLAPNAHGHTLVHTVLLAAFAATAPGLERWGWARRAAWALALAALLAAGGSSDVLLLVGGVAGIVGAAAVGWRSRALTLGTASVVWGAVAAGVVGAQVLVGLAHGAGVASAQMPLVLAGADQVMPHVRMLLESLGSFAHGRFGGELSGWSAIHEMAALAVFAGVPLAVAAALRSAAAATRRRGWTPTQRMLVAFWATTCATTAAAYVATDSAVDLFGGRYLLGLWPGLLTLAALALPATIATRGLVALVLASAVLGVLELHHGDYTAPTPGAPQGRDVGALARLVRREHLDHGYAGYWEAAEITAQTDFAVHLYPVQPCGDQGLCPPPLHQMDTWYVPQRRPIRTFYLYDPQGGTATSGPPPARWGRPAEHRTLGRLEVYVYDGDLAARLPAGT